MRTKLSLALSAVLAALLFAGAATAAPAPANGNINKLAPNTKLNSGMIKKPKIKMPNLSKIKNQPKFKYPKKERRIQMLGRPDGLNSGNKGHKGNNHRGNGHGHGFPRLHVGLGFGYNVTEVAPAVPYAAYPVACVVPPPAAAQPTLLDQVVARLLLLNELNRRDLIEDDEYAAQKTVVLLTLVPLTVAQEVGVAYGLQVLKCIEEQDLISGNEYDAKRKEFVAIL